MRIEVPAPSSGQRIYLEPSESIEIIDGNGKPMLVINRSVWPGRNTLTARHVLPNGDGHRITVPYMPVERRR